MVPRNRQTALSRMPASPLPTSGPSWPGAAPRSPWWSPGWRLSNCCRHSLVFPGAWHIIGTPLILLGSVVAVISYLEWTGNQRALRRGEPMSRSRLPAILAVTIATIGLLAAALALLSGVTRN